MTLAAAPGSNAGATRAASIAAASLAGVSFLAVLVRLSGSIGLVGILLLVAALLIGLILITAGCGPPN